MKTSIWNILTAVVMLVTLCMVAGFIFVLSNPGLAAVTPQLTIPTISLPTATATEPGLPPTWTPAAPVMIESTPTRRPTNTLFPTNTPVILPTFTASPRSSGGGSSGGGSGSGGGVAGGRCSVTFQQPADNTYQDPSLPFTMRWVVKNTSDETWRSDSVDIRFVSGDRMSGNNIDLPMDVAPGGQVDVMINMVTPSGSGKVSSNWGMFAGNTSLCRFFVEFNIK